MKKATHWLLGTAVFAIPTLAWAGNSLVKGCGCGCPFC
jgi:hypothetical protein